MPRQHVLQGRGERGIGAPGAGSTSATAAPPVPGLYVGYVVAGLAMLVWLKERPGEPSGAGAQRQGRPELVVAEG
jgi:hypothetical protein